jgi:hypothetical protein
VGNRGRSAAFQNGAGVYEEAVMDLVTVLPEDGPTCPARFGARFIGKRSVGDIV